MIYFIVGAPMALAWLAVAVVLIRASGKNCAAWSRITREGLHG